MSPSALRDAFRLLQSLSAPQAPARAPRTRRRLITPLDDFRIDVYQPAGKPNAPTVLLNHGLSASASDDPRMIRLASALCRAGLRVLMPLYPAAARLEISAYAFEELVAVFNAVAAGRVPGTTFPVAVAGVSFLGSLGMIAACDPRVELPVSCTLSVGAFSDLDSTVRGFMPAAHEGDPPADDYARLVFLTSWFDQVFPDGSPALRRRLRDIVTAPDAVGAALTFAPPDAGDLSDPADAALYRRLRDPAEPQTRARCLAVLTRSAALCRRLSPEHHVERFVAPAFLLHGRGDPVIPVGQGERLRGALTAAGKPVRALFTDAVEHGGTCGGLQLLLEQLRLAVFLAEWIDRVRRAAGRGVVVGGARSEHPPAAVVRRKVHGRSPVEL